MTIARAHLVDPSVTRWYHCVTRCVRRAFLLGEGMHDRKSWIEHRLEEFAEIFSVAVAGAWPGSSDACLFGEFDLLRPERPSTSKRTHCDRACAIKKRPSS